MVYYIIKIVPLHIRHKQDSHFWGENQLEENLTSVSGGHIEGDMIHSVCVR